jgi:hypothetical protein
MRTITREGLKKKLDGGEDFKLVNCLDEWMFRAKRIPGSIHFQSLKMALDALDPRNRSSSIAPTPAARPACLSTSNSSKTVFRTSGIIRAG